MIAESTTADALLSYICRHPSDDVARLVYADVLEERGEDARAGLIRVQVELAGIGPMDAIRGKGANLRRRERDLLAQARRLGFLADLPDGNVEWETGAQGNERLAITYVFRRGFVAEVSLPAVDFAGGPCGRCGGTGQLATGKSAGQWFGPMACPACRGKGVLPGHAAALFQFAPIEKVTLADREPVDALRPGDWWWWEESGSPEGVCHVRCDLPAKLFGLLAGGYQEAGWSGRSYPSREEGLADLATAALLLGRRRAWPCPTCKGRGRAYITGGGEPEDDPNCFNCRGAGHTVTTN